MFKSINLKDTSVVTDIKNNISFFHTNNLTRAELQTHMS